MKPVVIIVTWEGGPSDEVEECLKEALGKIGYLGPDSGYGFGERDLMFFLPEYLEDNDDL